MKTLSNRQFLSQIKKEYDDLTISEKIIFDALYRHYFNKNNKLYLIGCIHTALLMCEYVCIGEIEKTIDKNLFHHYENKVIKKAKEYLTVKGIYEELIITEKEKENKIFIWIKKLFCKHKNVNEIYRDYPERSVIDKCNDGGKESKCKTY